MYAYELYDKIPVSGDRFRRFSFNGNYLHIKYVKLSSQLDDGEMDCHWFRTFKMFHPIERFFWPSFVREETALGRAISLCMYPERHSIILIVTMVGD